MDPVPDPSHTPEDHVGIEVRQDLPAFQEWLHGCENVQQSPGEIENQKGAQAK